MPSGCPNLTEENNFSKLLIDSTNFLNWFSDVEMNVTSSNDKSLCEVDRKKDYNEWCNVNDAAAKYIGTVKSSRAIS